MCTIDDDEVCRLRNMFCKIKYIVFKIKILTVLLLCRSFGNIYYILYIYFCLINTHNQIKVKIIQKMKTKKLQFALSL